MILHPRARTTPILRQELVARVIEGAPIAAVARDFNVSRQTVYKWISRAHDRSENCFLDRSSRPNSSPRRTSSVVEEHVISVRRNRRLFAWQIALGLGLPRSTVIRILHRARLARLTQLDVPPVYTRYEYGAAGDLLHIDIKKLARIEKPGHRIHGDRTIRSAGAGWEHVYVCIDDSTRVAYLEVRDREHSVDAAAFLKNAASWFSNFRVRVQRVMTDNGKVFLSRSFQPEVENLGARHVRTPPYTPRVNGKAERFIRTMLGECAYAVQFANSAERRAGLSAWVQFYNEDRPHSAIRYQAPLAKLLTCQQRV
jgi:transposase InsO family protein